MTLLYSYSHSKMNYTFVSKKESYFSLKGIIVIKKGVCDGKENHIYHKEAHKVCHSKRDTHFLTQRVNSYFSYNNGYSKRDEVKGILILNVGVYHACNTRITFIACSCCSVCDTAV